MSTKVKLIINLVTLVFTTVLLIISIFGWYTSNNTVRATGLTGVTTDEELVHILEPVIARRHYLNGDIETNTYERDDSDRLVLVSSELESNDTTTTVEVEENTYFSIIDLLPGEYVDITIGYKIDLDEANYKIELRDLNGDSFEVDSKTHYVSGVFKYKCLSLVAKGETDNVSDYTPDTNYTWLGSYDISKDDTRLDYKRILSHEWDSSYDELYFTFRISEDFSQYYNLISLAEGKYGNLLSTKTFSIGKIYLYLG